MAGTSQKAEASFKGSHIDFGEGERQGAVGGGERGDQLCQYWYLFFFHSV